MGVTEEGAKKITEEYIKLHYGDDWKDVGYEVKKEM